MSDFNINASNLRDEIIQLRERIHLADSNLSAAIYELRQLIKEFLQKHKNETPQSLVRDLKKFLSDKSDGYTLSKFVKFDLKNAIAFMMEFEDDDAV